VLSDLQLLVAGVEEVLHHLVVDLEVRHEHEELHGGRAGDWWRLHFRRSRRVDDADGTEAAAMATAMRTTVT
jgi:hypothetical protein